jgi:hypothetical protein
VRRECKTIKVKNVEFFKRLAAAVIDRIPNAMIMKN